jgi:hypothetical protein
MRHGDEASGAPEKPAGHEARTTGGETRSAGWPARVARILRSNELQQAALALVALLVYLAVREVTQGSYAAALDHAHAVADFERRHGFYWEPRLQRQIIGDPWLVTAANWLYVWAFWPVIGAVALWLLIERPATFRIYRNAFFISGAIGLIIFAIYPVAPPRLSGIGLVDTVTLRSHAYRILRPPSLVNQYAAVPSLHFGWELLTGIAVVREVRWWPVRILGVLVPPAMCWAIVVTGNHYIFDALAGAAVVLAGLAIASAMAGSRPA